MKTKTALSIRMFCTLLLGLLFMSVTALAQPNIPNAFDQCKALGRGVNVLGYDPIWRSRDQAHFQAKHFKLLKEAGFSSVRINLSPFRHMDGSNQIRSDWFSVLDWAVNEAQANGLRVILDNHEYGAMGERPEENKERFLDSWRQLSSHYQNAGSGVYFEILNEPNKKMTPELWNQYLSAALTIIRQSNPRRSVIVGPAFWNSIDHLKELELPDGDANLIVTIHYYSPMDFTHQGAAWADRKDKLGVEWTGNEKEMAALDKDFDKADAWAKEHHRPIFLGEFGAYDKAPMDGRVRYISAVARSAERRGWSWAYWQFDSDFILWDMKQDKWVEPILKALIP